MMAGMAELLHPREGLCSEVNDALGLRCDRQEGHKPEGTHWQDNGNGIMVWGPSLSHYRPVTTGRAGRRTSSSGSRRTPKK